MSNENKTIPDILHDFALKVKNYSDGGDYVEAKMDALAGIESVMAAERLKARIDELNHTLITDGSYWSGSREDIRMTRQERITQLTHQAQAGGENEG